MLTLENLHTTDFEQFKIDTQWNFESDKENKMHRIHTYPAKFPAFIVKKALQFAESKNCEINVVADIFCGCGTTAYEASRAGKSFWGCDINPVASLIAKVKSGNYKQKSLDKYFAEITHQFNTATVKRKPATATNPRIQYWFEDQQIIHLDKLKTAIYNSTPASGKYRSFFLCAFSNILKPTSKWLQKSIKPTIDRNKKTVDVWSAFCKQFKMMSRASTESPDKPAKIKIAIETGNFMSKRVANKNVDLLVTSPPYVTSYEYADLHQLSLLWLDFTDDFRDFRQGSIGSSSCNFNSEKNKNKLNKTGRAIVSQLTPDNKKKAHVAKYFSDMQKVIKKSYVLLNTGGYALFVIGNTEYQQVRIDNAKHLVESMFNAGYKEIEVSKRKISNKLLTCYRDATGKFTSDKTSRKIYAEEFVIIGKK